MTIALLPASRVILELGSGGSTSLEVSDPDGGVLFLNPVGTTGMKIEVAGLTELALGNIPGTAGRNPEYRVLGDVLQYRLIGDVPWIDLVDLSTFIPGTLWGLIGGTLSNQTDLQAALNAKLDDSQAAAFGLTLLGAVDAPAARTSLAYTTTLVPEGSNLYFTDGRAIAAPLTGYAAAGARTALAASDTVLGAFNKVGKWLNDLVAIAFTGSAADLSGTKTATFISDFSAAADARITAQKAVASGLATLDGGGKIPTSQLPALAITDRFVVASQVAMLALTAETGDIAIRTDLNKSFILGGGGNPATLGDWQELLTPTDNVLSVNGFTGAVTLTSTNIAEGTNQYFTEPRVRATVLTGFAAAGARTAIAAADSILTAFGKAQKYFNDLSALAFSGAAADLTGTKTSAFISDFAAAVAALITGKQGNIQFQDEGIAAGAAGANTTINFTGAGVAAVNAGNTLTVTIGGGGGGGSLTITTVEIDFGSTPATAKFFTVTVPGATLGQKVIATVALDMPAGVDEDELEADPITIAGKVSAPNAVRLLVASINGNALLGKRNINVTTG